MHITRIGKIFSALPCISFCFFYTRTREEKVEFFTSRTYFCTIKPFFTDWLTDWWMDWRRRASRWKRKHYSQSASRARAKRRWSHNSYTLLALRRSKARIFKLAHLNIHRLGWFSGSLICRNNVGTFFSDYQWLISIQLYWMTRGYTQDQGISII